MASADIRKKKRYYRPRVSVDFKRQFLLSDPKIDFANNVRLVGEAWQKYKLFLREQKQAITPINVVPKKVTKDSVEVVKSPITKRFRESNYCPHIVLPEYQPSLKRLLDVVDMSVDFPVIDVQLPYHHDGQRKLFVSEFELLSNRASDDSVVIYAGAAPGTHLPLLIGMFPQLEYYLYDPRDYNKELVQYAKDHTNVTLVNKLLDENSVKDLKSLIVGRDVIFISDIRTSKGESPTDEEIKGDMDLQLELVTWLNPLESLLKFRMPYVNDDAEDIKLDYPDGEVRLPVWGPVKSTECRLYLVGPKRIRKFSAYNITTKMNMFGTVLRGSNYGGKCYDCTAEYKIITDAFRRGAIVMKPMQIVRALNDLLGSPLEKKQTEAEIAISGFKKPMPSNTTAVIDKLNWADDEVDDLIDLGSEEDTVIDTTFKRGDQTPRAPWIAHVRTFKEMLYKKTKCRTVLDLAGGQGGDFNSWERLGYRVVYHFDKDGKAVQEAVRRYREGVNGKPYSFNLYIQNGVMQDFDTEKVEFLGVKDKKRVRVNVNTKIHVNVAFSLTLLTSKNQVKKVLKLLKTFSKNGHEGVLIFWNFAEMPPKGITWKVAGAKVFTTFGSTKATELNVPMKLIRQSNPKEIVNSVKPYQALVGCRYSSQI